MQLQVQKMNINANFTLRVSMVSMFENYNLITIAVAHLMFLPS